MSIPRVDLLLKSGRILSLSKDYGESHGIQQDFFVEALNKANMVAHNYLVAENCAPFPAYKDYEITTLTESISVPEDIFIPGLVYEVRYSPSGLEADLNEPLELMYTRGFSQQGEPEEYLVDGSTLYLHPLPSSGMIRIKYEQLINRLDLRRGVIESHSGVTSFVVADDDTYDSTAWLDQTPEYVCLVNYKGIFYAKNIPISSWDSATRTATIESGYALSDGESITDGAYITFGQNCSTHSSLPNIGELFYLQFMQDEVNDLLSSDDKAASEPKYTQFLSKLSEIYAQLPQGFNRVPQRNRNGF